MEEVAPDQGPNPARPPSNFYVQGVDARGGVWMAINDRKAQPALPGRRRRTRFGDPRFDQRLPGALARGLGSKPGGELITVAVDLSDVQATVRSLVLLQMGIGSAVLLVLGVAGYWVVNRSLQPLVEVEDRGHRRRPAGKPSAAGQSGTPRWDSCHSR